ncbi:septum site-determining protein minD, partial [Actinoplanes sp. NPDC051633]
SSLFGAHCSHGGGVGGGPGPARLRAREVARVLSLPLAGELAADPAMCERLERGDAPAGNGRGPLAELCRQLIADLTGGAEEAAA